MPGSKMKAHIREAIRDRNPDLIHAEAHKRALAATDRQRIKYAARMAKGRAASSTN